MAKAALPKSIAMVSLNGNLPEKLERAAAKSFLSQLAHAPRLSLDAPSWSRWSDPNTSLRQ